jgi:hypothetical protein
MMTFFFNFLASFLAWMEHTEAHRGFGVGLFVFYFGITQKNRSHARCLLMLYETILRCLMSLLLLALSLSYLKNPHIEKHASALLVQPRWFM